MSFDAEAIVEKQVPGADGAPKFGQFGALLVGQQFIGSEDIGGECDQIGKRGKQTGAGRINSEGCIPRKVADIDW